MNTSENFINGEHVNSEGHCFSPIFNPAIEIYKLSEWASLITLFDCR
ncbi:hypothetical protein [Marinomonas sp. 2405UD68-3]